MCQDALQQLRPGSVKLIPMTLDPLRTHTWSGMIESIRKDPAWLKGKGVKKSPQATLELYNFAGFSRLSWLQNAAEQNYFNTDAFLWIDGVTLTFRFSLFYLSVSLSLFLFHSPQFTPPISFFYTYLLYVLLLLPHWRRGFTLACLHVFVSLLCAANSPCSSPRLFQPGRLSTLMNWLEVPRLTLFSTTDPIVGNDTHGPGFPWTDFAAALVHDGTSPIDANVAQLSTVRGGLCARFLSAIED